ncbi:MAG: hypothetical protein GY832_23610 [Chloroflexi bacterium]|nr:hypothetical protein [Chloroflexota bacterium]
MNDERKDPTTSIEPFLKTTTDAAGKEFKWKMYKALWESALIGDDFTECRTKVLCKAWFRGKRDELKTAKELRARRKENRKRADQLLHRLGLFRVNLSLLDYQEGLLESLSHIDTAMAHLERFIDDVNPDGTIPEVVDDDE